MKISLNARKGFAFVMAIVIFLTMGCTRYFKPIPGDTSTPQAAGQVVQTHPDKYYILRQAGFAYFMDSISVDQEAMALNTYLTRIGTDHTKYIMAQPRKYGYSNAEVENEIHIYSKDTTVLFVPQHYTMPLDHIAKIELIVRDTQRTTGSRLIGAGVTLGVIAGVVALGVIASSESSYTSGTSCSCPTITAFDGKEFKLQGEIYTGAISPNIEKYDFLPLSIQPVNNEYQINVSNDQNERAYTDYTHLSLIAHDPKDKIGIGTDGKPYLLSALVSPISANLNGHQNMLSRVLNKDEYICSFDDTSGTASTNDLVLDFPVHGQALNGKLVLSLRNSVWLAYVYEQYLSHFGQRYDDFLAKSSKKPASEVSQWIMDQDIPLRVSVNSGFGWKEITVLNTIGMKANRELVIPLPFEHITSNHIQVRLSTGFLFWELDYAAMDFTPPQTFSSELLVPYSAINENGTDVSAMLTKEDGIYYEQREPENMVTLKYKMDTPVRSDKSYAVVLQTKGYYELVRDYQGPADGSFLKPFKNPDALSDYSKQMFKSVLVTHVLTLTDQ